MTLPFTIEEPHKLPPKAVQAQLDHILSSAEFAASPSLVQFLQFVVMETLQGRAEQIKAYTIAVRAWGRSADFDPQADPIVRIQAGRLRRALQDYYSSSGAQDSIHIELPKGTYVPRIRIRREAGSATAQQTAQGGVTKEPIVAVLPFRWLGGAEAYPHVLESIGEGLSVQLSHFSTITVLGYYSCLHLRDADDSVQAIGEKLGADFVIGGSLIGGSKRLRLSVFLLETRSGLQRWAQQFEWESNTADYLDVQDEIVERIVTVIGSRFGVIPDVVSRASLNKPPDRLDLHEAVVRFTEFSRNFTPEAWREAEQALERAVTIDPSYARAWAALGGLYAATVIAQLTPDAPDHRLEQALRYVRRALNLNPLLPDSYGALANIYFQCRDINGLLRACRRLVELNPKETTNVALAGFWLTLIGEKEQGFAYLDRGLSLNPHLPGWFQIPYCLNHFQRRAYAEAYLCAQKINVPTLFWDPLLRSAALARLGHTVEAQNRLGELLRLKPDFPTRAQSHLSTLIVSDGLCEQVLAALHEAGLARD